MFGTDDFWEEKTTRDWLREKGGTAPDLLPLEEFPDTPGVYGPAKTGTGGQPEGGRRRPSPTVRMLVCSTTAGWKNKPDAAEFEDRIRSREDTPLNREIAAALLGGLSWSELSDAERDGAFSLQDLAWWTKTLGPPYPDRILCYLENMRKLWAIQEGRKWRG